MDAQAILSQLGSTYGINLTFNESGVCSASFDKDDLDFQLAEDRLYIVAEIGSAEDKKSVLKHFFGANLSPAGISGGYFGFDETYGGILFVRVLPSQMEYPDFENILVASIKVIREAKEKLAELVNSTDSDESQQRDKADLQFDATSIMV